ncbi:MAG: ADP-ribosylglycohydrolase family protein [Terrimicrobiaceae bacterium]
MHATREQIEGGLLGLLVGDALGVPYEFHEPGCLPARRRIEMVPPSGFRRSYSHVPAGTWSDDGAQALCLFVSLRECRGWDARDFAGRLLDWYRRGYLAVDGRVFDVGIQTAAALDRLVEGVAPLEAGLAGERNNGNGSLMRTLPLALLHGGDEASLVRIAHEQSRITHAHPRSQVCCALYALWALAELRRDTTPWELAVQTLRLLYKGNSVFGGELGVVLEDANPPTGTGYVVDCLRSARQACFGAGYEEILRSAVAFGHDTDTTACVAGGIAGIRHGVNGIPSRWLLALRGRKILDPLLARL